MTADTNTDEVERVAARLECEEQRLRKVADHIWAVRAKHTGPAFTDINSINHSLAGRDAVLEDAASLLRTLAARERAAVERAENAEAEAAKLAEAVRHVASSRVIVQETVMDPVVGPTYVTYGINWRKVDEALASYKGGTDG
jgi:hypothetical protein